MPIVNIVGDLVALGPLRRDLLPDYQRWINDLAAAQRIGLPPRPMSAEQEAAWYDEAATTWASITFTIYERSTWRAIGSCALIRVDHQHGTAEIVMLIGETASRGNGYGTEAVRLLLDFAFTALGLRNVMLSVDANNPAARRAYEKAGFKEMGRRRQAVRTAGRRTDEIYMDCLATECASPVLASVMRPD